jgi:hypothetical protein
LQKVPNAGCLAQAVTIAENEFRDPEKHSLRPMQSQPGLATKT